MPTMRLRLPRRLPRRPEPAPCGPGAPITVFFPALDEEVTVAGLIARLPGAVATVFLDADEEYDPRQLPDLVAPILDGRADYVVGSRFDGEIAHMRPHRRLGNVALTKALSWIARRRITDGQTGYRALSAGAAAAAEVVHDYNYAQVLTIDLLAKGFAYHEVPITYRFRTTGRSFVRLPVYLRRCVPAVLRELATSPEVCSAVPVRVGPRTTPTAVERGASAVPAPA